MAPFQLSYAVQPPLLFHPPSSNGRKLILSSHNSSPPFFLSVIRFKRYLCRVNRTAPFTCVIQRRISSQRHDRSRKSVVRDEIPPKWITCSRLLRPDLARGFDMEDIWWCIFSACGSSIGLDRFARRFKIIFYSRGDV